MIFVHDEYRNNKTILAYMNQLIRELGFQDFHDLPSDDKDHLIALFFNADDVMAVESVIEGDHWQTLMVVICNNLSGLATDANVASTLRAKISRYLRPQVEAMYAEQVADWKCDVTSAEGM